MRFLVFFRFKNGGQIVFGRNRFMQWSVKWKNSMWSRGWSICLFFHLTLHYKPVSAVYHLPAIFETEKDQKSHKLHTSHRCMWLSYHTLNSKMVSPLYEFFHDSLKYLLVCISYHTLKSKMLFLLYEFFHDSLKYEFLATLRAIEWFLRSVDSFMSLQITWCGAFLVPAA